MRFVIAGLFVLTATVCYSAPITIDYTYDDLNRVVKEEAPVKTSTFNYDEAGNITDTSVADSAPADTVPPTIPPNLRTTSVTSTTVGLAWDAATDDQPGTIYYAVYRNGAQIALTAARTYSDGGRTSHTTYTYTVKAKDAAGNLSAASNAVTVTTL